MNERNRDQRNSGNSEEDLLNFDTKQAKSPFRDNPNNSSNQRRPTFGDLKFFVAATTPNNSTNIADEEERQIAPALLVKTPMIVAPAIPKSPSVKGRTPAKAKKSVAEEESTPNRQRSTRVKKEEAKATPSKIVKKEPAAASAKNSRKRGAPKDEETVEDEEEVAETESKIPAKRAKTEEESTAVETNATPRRASTRTKAAKTPKGKGAAKKVKQESDAEDNEIESYDEEEINLKESTSVAKPPKPQEEAPKLTAEEQIIADDESNVHFLKGARVFAIWGKEYYSAVCDDSDGLGRYKVFYTEDQSIRKIPRAGVIPLYMIKEGSQVSFFHGEKDEDGQREISEGKVLEVPSIKNAEEWHRGLFKIVVENDEGDEPETREVEWFDIYFTEPQYKQIIKTIKNPTAVDQEKVVESGRRILRFTATTATPSSTTTASSSTPFATPKTRRNNCPKPKGSVKETFVENDAKDELPLQAEEENKENCDSVATKNPSKFFQNLQFILTSANRQNSPTIFVKKEVRKQIESRGGNVVETFEAMNADLTTYLIADTFYRTHKYLTALSMSVPTVSFKWINKCVEENKLVDYKDFMLDAGESETTGEIFKWKPLKGQILVGKKIAVYSRRGAPPTNNGIDFCQIWSPLVFNLGAELVVYPAETDKAVEFFLEKNSIDYFIADDGTPQELINAVKDGGGIPVTSEWIIHTIITGSAAPTDENEMYIFK